MNITKIDKNLAVEAVINKDDIKYYDVADGTFGLYGLYKPYGKKSFTRMPEEIADNVSEGVKHLNHIYTGARVRFITNSKYVAVSSEFLLQCGLSRGSFLNNVRQTHFIGIILRASLGISRDQIHTSAE